MAIRQSDVQAAILAGTTRWTRRSEIYLSDGETLWEPTADASRLIDGTISVDSTRNERRTADLILDNADGILNHDPNGFWYDKIIKTYKGVKFTNPRKQPRVLVIEQDVAGAFIFALRRLGITDITYQPSAADITYFSGYDIIAAGSEGGVISSGSATLLAAAYAQGFAVLTQGIGNGTGQLPFATTQVTKNDAAPWQINRPTYDTAVSSGWESGPDPSDTSTGVLVTVLRPDARGVALWTWSGHAGYTAIIANSASGGVWFHMGTKVLGAPAPFSKLFKNGVDWLYGYNSVASSETQVGTFYIDKIDQDWFPSYVKVTVRDPTKVLLGTKLSVALTFTQGTPVEQVIAALAANGGVTNTLLSNTGVAIGADTSFDRTTDRWTAIQQLANSANLEVFFNPQGSLVTRPFRDPLLSPITLVLATGNPDGNLVKWTKSSDDSRLYNEVVVTGEDPSSVTAGIYYQGIAQNTDPSSPTHIKSDPSSTSGLTARTYFYTSAFFTSDEQCQAYANSLLSTVALEEFNLAFSSLAFPWLEAGDILRFDDPDRGVDEPSRFLLSSFNLPLGLGPMDGSGKRVTIVGQA